MISPGTPPLGPRAERRGKYLVLTKAKRCICPQSGGISVDYAKTVSPISISGTPIAFSNSAEHVGIVRSIEGNLPNILERLSAHKRAVFSVLSAGLGRGQSGNPAASLRVERLYGIPVMLSGLATMVLSKTELAMIDTHFKIHIERLLKLHRATPECVVWFLAGVLPAQALIHLRQFSLFGMLCRLQNGNNVLANHGRHMLACAKPSSKSWFLQIQELCLQYSLPHPIYLLDNPPTKLTFKSMVKSKVLDLWQYKLRPEAALLPSLKYFSPVFMSLSNPHPLFKTCAGSPYEVTKAVLQARYLSGRGRVESLTRQWDPTNRDGNCSLCVSLEPVLGTIEHIFLGGGCPALVDARLSMLSFMQAYMVPRQYLLPILKVCWGIDDRITMQFLMDFSLLPSVIKDAQESTFPGIKDLFYPTRTYLFKLHQTRQ